MDIDDECINLRELEKDIETIDLENQKNVTVEKNKEIISYKDFKLENLKILPYLKSNLGLLIPCNYDDKKFEITTPKLEVKNIEEIDGKKYLVSILEVNTTRHNRFKNVLSNLENKHILDISKNTGKLPGFLNNSNYSDLHRRFQSPIKYLSDGSVLLYIKLPFRFKQYECDIFDCEQNLITIFNLQPGKFVRVCLNTKGAWCNKFCCGITYSASQIMIF